jgi:hypothetical protein
MYRPHLRVYEELLAKIMCSTNLVEEIITLYVLRTLRFLSDSL